MIAPIIRFIYYRMIDGHDHFSDFKSYVAGIEETFSIGNYKAPAHNKKEIQKIIKNLLKGGY